MLEHVVEAEILDLVLCGMDMFVGVYKIVRAMIRRRRGNESSHLKSDSITNADGYPALDAEA